MFIYSEVTNTAYIDFPLRKSWHDIGLVSFTTSEYKTIETSEFSLLFHEFQFVYDTFRKHLTRQFCKISVLGSMVSWKIVSVLTKFLESSPGIFDVFFSKNYLLLENIYVSLLHPSLPENLMCSRNKFAPGKKNRYFSKNISPDTSEILFFYLKSLIFNSLSAMHAPL